MIKKRLTKGEIKLFVSYTHYSLFPCLLQRSFTVFFPPSILHLYKHLIVGLRKETMASPKMYVKYTDWYKPKGTCGMQQAHAHYQVHINIISNVKSIQRTGPEPMVRPVRFWPDHFLLSGRPLYS